MSHVRLVVLGSFALLSFVQGGCSGCNEEYYCDDTGCYWCDSYGCRPVDPPARAECSHGDWECPPDRPLCTEDGYCVAQCTADADCPTGLRCLDGLCVEPLTPERPDLHPGRCGDGATCRTGEVCTTSGCCIPTGSDVCCADVDCPSGLVCDPETDRCVAPPADAGTGDAGTTDTAPPPTCRSNADCRADYGPNYLCIDGTCRLPCRSDAECGAGCHCVDGFCTSS